MRAGRPGGPACPHLVQRGRAARQADSVRPYLKTPPPELGPSIILTRCPRTKASTVPVGARVAAPAPSSASVAELRDELSARCQNRGPMMQM